MPDRTARPETGLSGVIDSESADQCGGTRAPDLEKMISDSYRDGFSMGEYPALADYTEAALILISALEKSEKEAKARFEAALKGALNTPHKPLKEKPKVKKTKNAKKGPGK